MTSGGILFADTHGECEGVERTGAFQHPVIANIFPQMRRRLEDRDVGRELQCVMGHRSCVLSYGVALPVVKVYFV